jgi:MoxR-like ATPase
VQSVRDALRDVNYLADDGIAGVAYLADRLSKPVLVEGPAGTGKTQLAKSIAEITDARLIRLQCYEGLDESKALYEWNYKKQLLRIQTERGDQGEDWTEIKDDIFSDEFLLTRPLLEAITATDPVVLLIDEVDRVEVETEALLLEVLSEYQVSIPELGTIEAKQIPLVFLTSNNTRELSEALKRRCLFLHVDYPELEREKEIVLTKVPDITDSLADQVARIVRSIRQLELKKSPSVSETIDWARTLLLLGVEHVDAETAKATINILLKYQSDIAKAVRELDQEHDRILCGDGLQQGSGEQELVREDVVLDLLPGVSVPPLGLDPQQLLLVVPLEERLGLIQALVALQADEPRPRHLGDRLGELRLAGASWTLDEDRLPQPVGQVHDPGDALVRQVVDLAEAIAHLGDGLESVALLGHRRSLRVDLTGRSIWFARRQGSSVDDGGSLRSATPIRVWPPAPGGAGCRCTIVVVKLPGPPWPSPRWPSAHRF